MFHVAAFTIADVTTTVNTVIPAIADNFLSRRNNAFFIPQPMQLLWSFFGSADPLRARLVTPTWRVIANPQIRPINNADIPAEPVAVADYRMNPLRVPNLEELSMEATDNSGTTVGNGLIGLGVASTPLPSRDIYTLRVTSTTAAVANAWTQLTSTFDDELPAGRYAIAGLNYIAANAIGARIIVSGSTFRPGCVGAATEDQVPSKIFSNGLLGNWGEFDNTVLPQFEVFNNSTDSTHTFFMDVMKLN